MSELLLDRAGRRRSPATMPGFHAGRPPRNKGLRYPADPPKVEEIISVMRTAGTDAHGRRLRGLIVVLWRAGLRIQEALALVEADLDHRRGALLVRRGKGGRRREVGMDTWGWDELQPWLELRVGFPVGPLFCVLNGPTRGRQWSSAAARTELRRTAVAAGVRRRFAPHQLRHAHAVEMAREGVPLVVIQRQLGHSNLGITSVYPQGIDNAEIIDTVHARRAPMIAEGRLPEAWIPPEHVRQWRSRARLRHTLIGERTQWMQRIQATLFHDGVHGAPEKPRTDAGRAFLDGLELPDDACERIEIALAMIDALDTQIAPLERELRRLARRQTGCRALMSLYGMGELTSLVTLCELGDVQRLSASRKAVHMAGIDIGVHRSDRRTRAGKLTRQGSPQLRWALYEAALSACRPSSPDHADYLALKARGLTHTRASVTIACKLARRSFHVLRELGPAALEPIAAPTA